MLVPSDPILISFGQNVLKKKQRELSSTSKEKEDELVLAAIIGKKIGMWNKGKEGAKLVQNQMIKKYKSKLKCFNCGQLGHFATK